MVLVGLTVLSSFNTFSYCTYISATAKLAGFEVLSCFNDFTFVSANYVFIVDFEVLILLSSLIILSLQLFTCVSAI